MKATAGSKITIDDFEIPEGSSQNGYNFSYDKILQLSSNSFNFVKIKFFDIPVRHLNDFISVKLNVFNC